MCRLACYALTVGVEDYHGPAAEADGAGRKRRHKRKGRPGARGRRARSMSCAGRSRIAAPAHNIKGMSGKDITSGPTGDVAAFVEQLRNLPSQAGAGYDRAA